MRRSAGPGLGFLLAALILSIGWIFAAWLADRNPLQQAWSAAQVAGRYVVTGTTTARTGVGVAAYDVSGTGSANGSLTLRLEPLGAMHTVSDAAGSDDPSSPVAFPLIGTATTYHIAWPDVTIEGGAALDPHALALLLPAGDPLTLLPAAHAPADAGPDAVDGRPCRRVSFLLNGLAYVPWWQHHANFLPVNGNNGPLEKLAGTGTLWFEESTGRPCRIAVRLELPRLAGDQPGVGEADWTYGGWDAPP